MGRDPYNASHQAHSILHTYMQAYTDPFGNLRIIQTPAYNLSSKVFLIS